LPSEKLHIGSERYASLYVNEQIKLDKLLACFLSQAERRLSM
jgi:hypothetical protein